MLQPSHRMVTPSVEEVDREDWRAWAQLLPAGLPATWKVRGFPVSTVRANLVGPLPKGGRKQSPKS